MTPDELKHARKSLGLTAVAFAKAFDVNPRTVRSWEKGEARAPQVPHLVAVLMQLALEQPSARLALGIPSKGKTAKATRKTIAARPDDEGATIETD